LAAHGSQCPVGYISFMAEERMWPKAKCGLPPDFMEWDGRPAASTVNSEGKPGERLAL